MQPLEMKQLKEHIVKDLRGRILSGAYPEGYELVQEAIASELGVSRMPVREALQILEQEGLVERLRNRHMRVIGISEESLRAHGRVLAAMASEIGLMRTEASISAVSLRKAYEAMAFQLESEAAAPGPVMCRLALEFHRQLRFEGLGGFVIQNYDRLLSAFFTLSEVRGHCDHRKDIMLLKDALEALESGNGLAFSERIRKYYDNVIDALIKDDQHE